MVYRIYRKLTEKAKIRIHPNEITQLENTLSAGMYAPCRDIERGEPLERTSSNLFRVSFVVKLLAEITKWKASGKLWIVRKNEAGMDVKVTVEMAIVIFEICEASNSPELLRLKGNVQVHLKENFNIQLESTKHILS